MSARMLTDWEPSVSLTPQWDEGLEDSGEIAFDFSHFDSAPAQPLLTLIGDPLRGQASARYLDLSRVLRETRDTAFEILQPRPLSPHVL